MEGRSGLSRTVPAVAAHPLIAPGRAAMSVGIKESFCTVGTAMNRGTQPQLWSCGHNLEWLEASS
ncbi:hypothetical protein P7K49_015924 [Saguinus oedipus]|uniref:Uncharacterized protein n=1 Tax=Saguinus oedipus TaxID=9490 RepID=A0ABQ9VBE6_SAGOE|nr:hypothetical protein P7K49_015924 [Saguinus oedipus]